MTLLLGYSPISSRIRVWGYIDWPERHDTHRLARVGSTVSLLPAVVLAPVDN
jgi:hypothetical protein